VCGCFHAPFFHFVQNAILVSCANDFLKEKSYLCSENKQIENLCNKMNKEQLMIVSLIFAMEYVLVFFAVMADLWSGVRKAKQRGEARTSYGFRRTVEKLAKYYNILIAVSVVDCMQIVGIHYLDILYGYKLPIFPLMTFIGSIGLGLIELKSIYEKAEDKDKDEYHQIARLVAEITKHRTDPDEIAKAVVKYLTTEDKKEDKHGTEEQNN